MKKHPSTTEVCLEIEEMLANYRNSSNVPTLYDRWNFERYIHKLEEIAPELSRGIIMYREEFAKIYNERVVIHEVM